MSEIVYDFHRIYSWLEDEESKDIYLNRLNFLITGDYWYIRNIVSRYVPDLAILNDTEIPKLLSQIPQDAPFILYGVGEGARATFHYFENDARLKGFCDSDERKQKNEFRGYAVMKPEELFEDKKSSIIITSPKYFSEISAFLMDHGVDEKRIFNMSPYIFAAQEDQYFNPDFMTFEDEEVFVDAGCCDLSSSIRLKSHCKTLSRVYAFEPDINNYMKCKKAAGKHFKDGVVNIVGKGTWSENKTIRFNASADGCSRVTENGGTSIEVVPIDDIIAPDEKVTFIKMDVEGSELESLKGARHTIRRCKPKLAVCIYHRHKDMYEIPLYIKELVPEYRLYVRHHSNGASETVLYAMPR